MEKLFYYFIITFYYTMKIFGWFLRRIVYGLWYLLFGTLCKKEATIILMYHCIGKSVSHIYPGNLVSVENFKDQIKILKRIGLTSLNDFALEYKEKKFRHNYIITFDDYYRDNYIYAYPLLKRWQIPATLFVTTNCINESNAMHWDKIWFILNLTKVEEFEIKGEIKGEINRIYNIKERKDKLTTLFEFLHYTELLTNKNDIDQFINDLSEILKVKKYPSENVVLSVDEIQIMSSDMEIGSHTRSHRILSKLDYETMKKEISGSKEEIENWISKTCNTFSYPFGQKNSFNKKSQDILKEQGFSCAVTSINGINNSNIDRYNLRRFMVPNKGGYAFKYWLMQIYFYDNERMKKLINWVEKI